MLQNNTYAFCSDPFSEDFKKNCKEYELYSANLRRFIKTAKNMDPAAQLE